MYRCKSYKEFCKIQRKYWKRNWHKNKQSLDIWLSYQITSVKDAERTLKHKKLCKGNLRLILNDFIQYQGYKTYFHGPNEYGIFYGIEITNEDYYYIYKVKNIIKYESCVGKIIPQIVKQT